MLNIARTHMKSLMILGSLVGFLIGAGFSLAGECPWPTALWRAAVAALLVAFLTRWWGRVWVQGLREALEQKRHLRPISQVNTKPLAKT